MAGLLSFARPVFAACTRTVTNTSDSGAGSLRQAITDSNNAGGLDEICFNISGSGVKTINISSILPIISGPTIIDGTTQPGYAGSPLIEISGSDASSGPGLWISGGSTTVRGLVINRIKGNGILIDGSGGNSIKGNYIGTNAEGTAALANTADGIGILSSPNHTIGGTTAADRNIISGNTGNGIGINEASSTGNVVIGNYIGTNAAGDASIGNADGILINNAPDNTIGGGTSTTPAGACTGSCNLLSGNRVNGIGIWHGGASGNLVKGNMIGLNVSGTGGIANGDIGIEINEAPNNTVGGTVAAERNVASGNIGAGVFITGSSSTGNVVLGNYVGTSTLGNGAIGNLKMGVGIGNSPGIGNANNNVIGGTAATTPNGGCNGACNVISGNGTNGILISGSTGGSNQIRGNHIGVNAGGDGGVGNGQDGVGILDSPNNGIGTGNASGRNVISGNGDNGVITAGGSSSGNRMDGNYIGLTSAGHALGNAGAGVMLAGGVDIAVVGNSIFGNGKLGIDLGQNNVTLNDAGDGDGGVNNQQNFPVIHTVVTGSSTTIYGNFKSHANTNYRLEFFDSSSCNGGSPLNYGEGHYYLGGTNVGTDQFGNVDFAFTPSSGAGPGRIVTATATKMVGNTPAETSEFSACAGVNSSKPAAVVGSDWHLRSTLSTGPADVAFQFGFNATTLMCAWDPGQPGVKLPVIVNGASWFMHKGRYPGAAALTFSYNAPGNIPVCGDWNNDGVETPGLVSGDRTWFLRDSNSSGGADAAFQYGSFDAQPVVGDWNGDGYDTIGTFGSNGVWNLRDSNSGGASSAAFGYGVGGNKAVVGDWNGDGYDTVGVISGSRWFVRDSNGSGPANVVFDYAFPGVTYLVWR